MLSTITILTFLIFAATYPLCFWISADDPLKNGFLRFHLGLPAFIAGIMAIFLFNNASFQSIHLILLLWASLLLLVTFIYWSREYPNPFVVTIPCIVGIICFVKAQELLMTTSTTVNIVTILAGFILSISFYAMNLGHWYLNVHGLDLKHLKRTMYLFWVLVVLRLLWDAMSFLFQNVTYAQGFITDKLYKFVMTTDGFLILVGLFFGVLFPVGVLYFVKGTLDVKNTQSATGILYVILSAVLLGELTYKYYLIKFGIAL